MDKAKIKEIADQAIISKIYPDPRFPPSKYYCFLMLLAHELKPNLSVELGVSGGGGSLYLCMGRPQGYVIGVDISFDHPGNISFIQNRYPRFKFIRGDSIKVASEIYQDYGAIDILFIDTVHSYEQSMLELETYKPFLSDKAVVCFDDLLRPEMAGVWEALPEPKVRLDFLHDGAENGGGFGVITGIEKP